MYKSSIHYERTNEERESELLSWKRSDTAFFAAGACHILAYIFKEMYPELECEIIFIRPKKPYTSGNHVYIRYGKHAFDFSGWTLEDELLSVFTADYRANHSGWSFDKIILKDPLEVFCDNNNHRKPEYFYADVITRAKSFLKNNYQKTPF